MQQVARSMQQVVFITQVRPSVFADDRATDNLHVAMNKGTGL